MEGFKLIWIKETVVKDELLLIFHRMYIHKYLAETVIDNLIKILSNSDSTALISLEEIIL